MGYRGIQEKLSIDITVVVTFKLLRTSLRVEQTIFMLPSIYP